MTHALALLILVAVLACDVPALAARQSKVPPALQRYDKYLTKLAKAKLFAGMAIVTRGGKPEFVKGYGEALPEFKLKMRDDHRYSIGSNTMILMAAAMWQLHARGLIHIDDTIDKHLGAETLGLPGLWCPQVYNETTGTAEGPCLFPKISDLLSHKSGYIDPGIHCRFAPGSWQADHCWAGPKGSPMAFNFTSMLASGITSPKSLLRGMAFFDLPLQLPPGTAFQDMTVDYVVAAAVLEQVTGTPVQAYLQDNIFKPAGMKDTYYELSKGNDGFYRNLLPLPGYAAYVSPLSLGMPALDFDEIGNLTLTAGDMGDSHRDPEGEPFGTFVKMGKVQGAVLAFDYPVVNAAGAVTSTLRDMARWYHVLTRQPQLVQLNQSLVKQMLTQGVRAMGLLMAQGVVTWPDSSLDLGTRHAFYIGNMGYSALHYHEIHPTDPSKDVHIGLVTYMQPYLGQFKFSTVDSGSANGATNPPGNALDPLNPNNGTTTCLMAVNDDPMSFVPRNGASGALPSRSEAAFKYFMQRAKEAGSPIASGPVKAPHFMCDAVVRGAPALDMYLSAMLAKAALGRQWFSEAPSRPF